MRLRSTSGPSIQVRKESIFFSSMYEKKLYVFSLELLIANITKNREKTLRDIRFRGIQILFSISFK